jgi:hypothetical protein
MTPPLATEKAEMKAHEHSSEQRHTTYPFAIAAIVLAAPALVQDSADISSSAISRRAGKVGMDTRRSALFLAIGESQLQNGVSKRRDHIKAKHDHRSNTGE